MAFSHPQFDFEFEQETYSRGAEQALNEREPSVAELEAAVKETPPRSSMSLSNGHGRTSSEPRALGDVMDESEKMLPSGSPGLRHTKGRLESSRRSPTSEMYADALKHETSPSTSSRTSREHDSLTFKQEPTSPATPSRILKVEKHAPSLRKQSSSSSLKRVHRYSHAHVMNPTSPLIRPKSERRGISQQHETASSVPQLLTSQETQVHESYADVVKHEISESHTLQEQDKHELVKHLYNGEPTVDDHMLDNNSDNHPDLLHGTEHIEEVDAWQSHAKTEHQNGAQEQKPNTTVDQNGGERSNETAHCSAERQPINTKHQDEERQIKSEQQDTNQQQQTFKQEDDEHDKTLTNVPQYEPAIVTEGESYADAVKHDPTSSTLPPISHDETKHEDDFADTATGVSDDDHSNSISGVGKDSSPRTPVRTAHKRMSSRSLNDSNKALQQALTEVDTLPQEIDDIELEEQQDQPKLEDIETKEQQDQLGEVDPQPGQLVYENYHSRSGTNLTSVQPHTEYTLALAQADAEDREHDQSDNKTQPKGQSTLVSGRRAGAGWARSAIRWAPLNVPLQRRLQTLAVLGHSLSIAGLLAFFFFLCAIPIFWPILVPYLIYVLLSRAPTDGKLTLRSDWVRRSKFWSLFASYFPARLHRTVELEPTRKYIFGYHPHGIISHGCIAAFATEALGFGQLFPGIVNTVLTLESNFRIPLYRDWALSLGLASVSRDSCENLLSRGGPNGEGMGRAITIVIGGARESLDAKPGTLNLVLKRRKGFVKLAVRCGADLVPVLAFGENDMYEQIGAETHPWIHKGQLLLKKFMGFTVPLFHARGIFNYDVGIMPYRRPINIVVGRPIKTVQSKKPNQAYVDDLHKQYTDELLYIWEEWKDIFAPDRNCELQIVE